MVTEYDDSHLQDVLDLTERMEHHLTAAVVSNDIHFLNKARSLVSMQPHHRCISIIAQGAFGECRRGPSSW